MIYLEMSRDEEHGGPGWGFTECLWSPTRSSDDGRWPFWELLLSVKRGDTILHLRGDTHEASIVGFSYADSDGFKTQSRPPNPGQWSYASSFYRVDLADYKPFPDSILLDQIFFQQNRLLREYFNSNKLRSPSDKERLFYVIQSNQLRCLNGAYLSEVSSQLAEILLGPDFSGRVGVPRPQAISVQTGEQISYLRTRVGQQQFSQNVKSNYGNRCCFPGCNITDSNFLIGAHIARWADNETLRGQTANGLCLCLLHDKAFEIGMFTLTDDFHISVNRQKISLSSWAQHNILPYDGQLIILGSIPPSVGAVHEHWERIRYRPS